MIKAILALFLKLPLVFKSLSTVFISFFEAIARFIDDIGLKEHLSPTRANGLTSMIKQIKMYAIAYQTQLK